MTNDSSPETILELFLAEWELEPPKLIITVHGGTQNFILPPKLEEVFKRGLFKAVKSTSAWLFTSGTNTGTFDCSLEKRKQISIVGKFRCDAARGRVAGGREDESQAREGGLRRCCPLGRSRRL